MVVFRTMAGCGFQSAGTIQPIGKRPNSNGTTLAESIHAQLNQYADTCLISDRQDAAIWFWVVIIEGEQWGRRFASYKWKRNNE